MKTQHDKNNDSAALILKYETLALELLEPLEAINTQKKRFTDTPFTDKELADLGAAVYDIMNRGQKAIDKAQEILY